MFSVGYWGSLYNLYFLSIYPAFQSLPLEGKRTAADLV